MEEMEKQYTHLLFIFILFYYFSAPINQTIFILYHTFAYPVALTVTYILPNHPFPLLYYNLLYFRHTFVQPQIYCCYFLRNRSIHSEIVAQLILSPTIPHFKDWIDRSGN